MSLAESAKRTLMAMELLTKGQQLAEGGDRDGAIRLVESAELDLQERIVYLRGGMMIGEVPRLESYDWPLFVQNQRDHVARLEEAERPDAPAAGPGSVSWAMAQHTADELDRLQDPREHP